MLIVKVYINNREIIMGYAVRRKGNEDPKSINTYELNDGTMVKHRYGDGAAKLAQKIIKRMIK